VENISQAIDSKTDAQKKSNQEYIARTNQARALEAGDKNKQTEPVQSEQQPEDKPIKFKQNNILHELEGGQTENQIARVNNPMTNHTVHQTTKSNFTIVSKQQQKSNDDIKQNAKAALRAKLEQNNPGPFSVEGPFGHDGPDGGLQDDFIAINGFPIDKGLASRNLNTGSHVQFKIREDPASKRGFTKEQKYFVNNKIVEEREDQVYPDNGWKEGVEFKSGIVSYRKEGDGMSDSSRDSDKDPSMLVVSALKNSKNSYAIENTSNISVRGGTYGGMSGMSLHDQSSRMSFRKDRSFDVRGEPFQSEGGSYIQSKKQWSRNELELPKPPSRYKSGVPQVNHGTKNNQIISQDDIVIEEGRGNKHHSIDMSPTKENRDLNNQDMKKFNLLDDLDNIYNQLESRNVPLDS
jgi:hypothetical protein